MSPCQHGCHREGGTGLSPHPACPFACPGTQPTPQHSSNKVIYSHNNGLVAPLWGHCGGHGGLWGPGDSRGSVPPSAALPSPEGRGVKEGRGGNGIPFPGIPSPRDRRFLRGNGKWEMGWGALGSGGDTAVPAALLR